MVGRWQSMSVQQVPQSAKGPDELIGYIQTVTSARASTRSLRAWCSWCCLWHIYGLPRPDDGQADVQAGDIEKRNAHCGPRDAPHCGKTLALRVSAVPFEEVRSLVREATYKQGVKIASGGTTLAIERLRAQVPPTV